MRREGATPMGGVGGRGKAATTFVSRAKIRQATSHEEQIARER